MTFLVALDGSHQGERALEFAAKLARSGDTVLLVHVIDPAGKDATRMRGARNQADDILKKAANAFRSHAEVAVEQVVVEGKPAAAITETARERGVDNIIMGRRGRGAFSGMLMGSVSDAVTKDAGIPVTVAGSTSARS